MSHSIFLVTMILCLTSVIFNNAYGQDATLSEENPATQVVPEEAEPFLGRWDLTLNDGGQEKPSWLEMKLSGYATLVGRYVGATGSARPVSYILLNNGKFSFSIPPQWEGGEGFIKVEGHLENGKLKGEVTSNKGEVIPFTGVKAPYLVRKTAPVWGESIDLFNGKNMDGWSPTSRGSHWEVVNGILTNTKPGANLVSDRKFDDFKLEVEFKYPEGSNSGIYLRGRYEVQIEDSPLDRHPSSIYFGGVYGFLSPNEMAALGPDQWQKMEITLVGRLVTIKINGKSIITRQEIPGITGGALDSHEGEPGPIYIQGDHGAIEFRTIKITPAK